LGRKHIFLWFVLRAQQVATTGLQAGRYIGSLRLRPHIVILRGAVIHMSFVSLNVMTIVVGEKENKARDNI